MIFRNLTAIQKGMVLIVVPLFFELVLLVVLASAISSAENSLAKIDYSRKTVLKLQSFENKLGIAMLTIINDNEGTKKQLEALSRIESLLNSPGIGDVSSQSNPELAGVSGDIEKLSHGMRELVNSARAVLENPAIAARSRIHYVPQLEILKSINQVLHFAKEVVRIENISAGAEPEQLEAVRKSLFLTLGGGIFLSLALSVVMAILFSRDILQRLKSIEESAHSLAAGQVLPIPPAANDEIGQLEETLYRSSHTLADWRLRERVILDSTVDVICSLDDKLRLLGVNNAAVQTWHYGLDQLLGRSIMSLIEPDKKNSVRSAFLHCYEKPDAGTFAAQIICGDSILRDTLWRVKWSSTEKTYYCVVRDVSAQRSVEKLRQRLVAMVCHDLRSPIMSLSISLELLGRESEKIWPTQVLAELAGAKENCSSLIDLTDKLLLLEKLESGTSAISLAMVSLQDAAIVASERTQVVIQKKQQIVLPQKDSLVLAEEEKLIQAIVNLIEYASSVSPEGAQLTILVEHDSDNCHLSVIDQGVSLSQFENATIFERFRSASLIDAGERPDFGLAIARALIEAHGGKVGAEPLASGGNRLWFSLPVYQEREV